MRLEDELEILGLTNKQARLYLALLELGIAKAQEVASKAGIERPTAYNILTKLISQGLASSFRKRGIQYFVAEEPEKIELQLREKQQLFHQVLPLLKSLQNQLPVKPKIRFYEGVAGIKHIFEDTLTTSDKKLRSILSVADVVRVPGKIYMDDYVARRVGAGIRLRVVRSRTKEIQEYWPADPQAFRELRYAPLGMVFTMTMYVYDHKVSLISSQKENFGMIIESAELSDNVGCLFEALWQVSTPGERT